MNRVQPIVHKYGKQVVAWEELGQATLQPNTLVQQWNTNPERRRDTIRSVEQGARVIMSPANKIYLDMQYSPETKLGQHWAAYVPVRAAYDWDPAGDLEGLPESAIAGVEAGLWTETLDNIPDLEYMVFPRLAGVAEIGWTPAAARVWDEYRGRLAAQGARWKAAGINFFEAEEIDW
jgi:hexosaminidase